MTYEQHIESILDMNPEFVAAMNEKVATEYADQIKATQESFAQHMETAKVNWIKNRGEDAYRENEKYIAEQIMSTLPRRCWIKNVVIGDDVFCIEIDLLAGTWSIA